MKETHEEAEQFPPVDALVFPGVYGLTVPGVYALTFPGVDGLYATLNAIQVGQDFPLFKQLNGFPALYPPLQYVYGLPGVDGLVFPGVPGLVFPPVPGLVLPGTTGLYALHV